MGADPGRALSLLESASKLDPDPSTGRVFAHAYEPGDPRVKEVALEAYKRFMFSNALNPLVYRSALLFEKLVVDFALKLMKAPENATGSFTLGGTESIILAALAARERFAKIQGRSVVPEIVAPVTAHPAIRKAAWLLSMKVVPVPVDPHTKKADVEAVKEAVGPRTSLVFLSAPNYPFGTVDPIREVAEYAGDAGVPVHVDACIGGFILPFLEELGWKVEPFDFRVEGVTSISLDVHKYGYSPKGASVVLFRERGLKLGSVYADVQWPGYPLINTALLSSRPVAAIASAAAVIELLGLEGYRRLAERVARALSKILDGLGRLGFKAAAPVESPIVALHLASDAETYAYHAAMHRRGWVLGLQPPYSGLSPATIHLTVTPVHEEVTEDFLRDSAKAVKEASESPERLLKHLGETVSREALDAVKLIEVVLNSEDPSVAVAVVVSELRRRGVDVESMARLIAVEALGLWEG